MRPPPARSTASSSARELTRCGGGGREVTAPFFCPQGGRASPGLRPLVTTARGSGPAADIPVLLPSLPHVMLLGLAHPAAGAGRPLAPAAALQNTPVRPPTRVAAPRARRDKSRRGKRLEGQVAGGIRVALPIAQPDVTRSARPHRRSPKRRKYAES